MTEFLVLQGLLNAVEEEPRTNFSIGGREGRNLSTMIVRFLLFSTFVDATQHPFSGPPVVHSSQIQSLRIMGTHALA
jgi:hypothetical protein